MDFFVWIDMAKYPILNTFLVYFSAPSLEFNGNNHNVLSKIVPTEKTPYSIFDLNIDFNQQIP